MKYFLFDFVNVRTYLAMITVASMKEQSIEAETPTDSSDVQEIPMLKS